MSELEQLAGVPVVTSPYVPPPRTPTPGEWARRYVRHGLADVLEWLGEPVGPEPGDLVHVAFILGFDPALSYARHAGIMVAETVISMRDPRQFVKIVGVA